MKKTSITLYYRGQDGKKSIIKYADVQGIRAGSALQILGEADARGNGIPVNAPLVQILLPGNETATYDADRITILF